MGNAQAHATVDVSDLIMAVRPVAVRAGLQCEEAAIMIVVAGVRQPEEIVAGPLLMFEDCCKIRLTHKQGLAEQLFHQNLTGARAVAPLKKFFCSTQLQQHALWN